MGRSSAQPATTRDMAASKYLRKVPEKLRLEKQLQSQPSCLASSADSHIEADKTVFL